MKKTLIFFTFLTLAAQSFAADFKTGSFEMYDSGYKPNGSCDVGSRLVLDKAEISGNVAFLSNFVNGFCELFVAPNPRHYNITSVKEDGCGSMIYKGSRYDENGVSDLEIIDHRTRLCEDIVPAVIILKENGHVMHSYHR